MEMTEGPIQVETLQELSATASQPAAEVVLSDDAVRAAIAQAEQQGINPESLTVGDLSQGRTLEKVAPTPVPQKFLKPDGEVDVEKLKASTKQLDEALAAKEESVTKSVDDYLAEYLEKEKKFRSLPNPEKLNPANSLPKAGKTLSELTTPMSDPEMEKMRLQILEDAKIDPWGTAVDFAVAKAKAEMAKELEGKLKIVDEIGETRKHEAIRSNIAAIASKDPRILNPEVYAAINTKLESNPELWKLKNPHKAAWLEVKEELRLGELPQGNPAPSSRPASPILGGGTPPSSPSSSGPTTPRASLAALSQFDPRDKKQEALGDEFIRSLLQGR